MPNTGSTHNAEARLPIASHRRPERSAVLVLLAGGLVCSAAGSTLADTRSRPAELIDRLDPPGVENLFVRPSALFVDRTHDEVFVADAGRNRITIFDVDGTYKYEFDGRDRFAAPLDVAVDVEGYIFVLGSTESGPRVFRFDFDGTFIDEVVLEPGAEPIVPASIAHDGVHLFVLDRSGPRISQHEPSGRLVDDFPVRDATGDVVDRKAVLGSLSVHDDLVWLPAASLGTVFVYERDGTFRRSVGSKGTEIGSLNFPVDVTVTGGDLVLVLDRNRFTVVCFDRGGRFRGEFGGRGISPGWYYYPSLLGADGRGRVYVGQVFRSKVEICRLPDFVRTDLHPENSGPESHTTTITPLGPAEPHG